MNRKLDTIFSKDKKIHCILLFVVAVCFLSITTAYSALYTTMDISGTAYARVEADVRITDFRLASTNNATSSFEEFGKNHTVTEVDLIDSTSSITYYLEITNYGAVDIGIFDITGLPEGVNYSIKDYNLHDKICDDSGKCNSFVTKTYEITLTTTSTYSGNVQLNFDFRTYHNVIYTYIDNIGYPVEVIDGGELSITFNESLERIQILSAGKELGYYGSILSGTTITFNNITSDVEVTTKAKVARLVSGSIDEVGSEVCIGKECFYIISNDGETVTMLSKYNLYVGNRVDVVNTPVPLENPTGIQNSSARGFLTSGFPYIGTVDYATSSHQGVNRSDYVGSIVKDYVDSYSAYLSSLDVILKNSRIVTYDELLNLGCSSENNTCPAERSWLYSTSYWTMTQRDASHVWNVSSRNLLGTSGMDYGGYLFGVRPVIEISVDEVRPLISVVGGDGTNVGDQVCIDNECFYVISSDEDNVTLFAKYNLLVGNRYDDSNKSKALENPSGKQDIIAKGGFTGYSVDNPIIGVYPFSADYYWTSGVSSYPAYVYNENSYVYSFIEDYKNYLQGYGINISDSRIISLEELENLGCSAVNYSCSDAPNWVYSTTYWSGTASSSKHLWRVRLEGSLSYSDYASYSYGIRPVIVIDRDILSS